jgi:FtsH-binding integral membrane protein
MSDYNGRYPGAIPANADMSVDAGLRAFMLQVYNKLGIGLALAGALSWVVGSVPAVTQLFFTVSGDTLRPTILGFAVQWAPLVVLLGAMFTMKNPTSRGASLLYWVVVALIGLSLGYIFLIYTRASVASTFFITAASFGGLSLVGYTTKKDLSGFGSFLIMGVIGILIASIVNMFLNSPMLYFIINVVGVLVFAGLIAYDTQKLKMTYYAAGGNPAILGPASSYGALSLFLDFVNLFLFLLRLFGSRR